ncbi:MULTISPECIES: OPT family oligopeptide transporter [Myxococcus]|uniref:OPT family oligopeptide transporter n=2 Tax=Myxococcus TaxID=32 RepID=A0A540WP59_9BACT|nr:MULTISPECIES: OPT family oligopeptide transporter [Myxococcus]NTX06222.1 OPT/YSL family transporter [Myxococcus sp. CA040A]TQF10813.1 OPT family oligopeptide transporter [Myxococcus llanfairpwllgwyngyllgogerychwyrndrobwllllantysiliogogogochensis]
MSSPLEPIVSSTPVVPEVAGETRLAAVSDEAPSPVREPREGTARALGMGLVVGALLAVTNVSMGLKLGWWESGSVTAAVLGFGGLAAVSRRRGSPYTPLENNLTQVTAVSVGAMPAAAGLLGPLPALMLLGLDVPGVGVAVWSVALGVLGVLAAHLLRRRLMEEEALAFPTGITTAELITAMHASAPEENRGRGVWLAVAAGVSAAITAVRDVLQKLPGMVAAPGSVGGVSTASLTWGLAWSPMLLAVGMMAGLHLGLSMLAGALVGWGVLAPWLLNTGAVKDATYDSLLGWLTWPGVGLLVGSAVVSLAAQARDFWGAAKDLGSLKRSGTLPRWAWLCGGAAAVVTLALGVGLFGMSVPQVLLALVVLLPLCAVCARGAGQVDVSPVTQVGQLSQVAAGVLLPGAVAPNIAVGGVVSGAAAQTGVSMWALKAGHLLGASPRRMLGAQLVGVLAGSLVSVPAYLLLTRAYGLGSEALPAPFSHQFRAVAELAVKGLAGLPPNAALAGGVAAGVGALLTLLARGRAARWMPSPVAMGIGFILPAYFAVTLCLGGAMAAVARWRWPHATGRNVPALAAGAIAAESLVGVLIGALKLLGFMA